MTRGHLWRYARIAVGIIFVAILIPQFLSPDFWTTLAKVNVPLVGLALLLSIASVASKAWRWGVVMRWRGIHLNLNYLLFSYFISMFFNNFLPSGFGGDAVRAVEAARHTGRGAESIISVVIERGSGMIAVFGAGSLFALTVPSLPIPVALLAHGLFVGTLIGIWALWLDLTGRVLVAIGSRLPKFMTGLWAKVMEIYDEFRLYRHEWRLLGAVMWQSIVTLILTLASVYVLLLAFNQSASFAAFAAIYSIVTAIDILPISLNGLGVRENAYVYFLGRAPLNVIPSVALGVAVLVRLLVFIQAGMGGIAWLLRSLRHDEPLSRTENEKA
ncbi:MAG TPA: lysylphosphatidylglycerol synthase transmembrane domain-containing protein [Aggregatilineales bacterium]|nr:lysylphosphatidylglycerol synthase transmembrane domain-containing protein [Aggregatilineales bacterium]